tara:strand:- start:220 stop:435 length:216 start_codon:yes stop_codon:yes gene_type:complete
MELLFIILKNIKNTLPYLLLIAIYFFFVNLEARKEKYNNRPNEEEYILPDDKPKVVEKEFRIRIPVIPYKE